jgi:hypothetical protein
MSGPVIHVIVTRFPGFAFKRVLAFVGYIFIRTGEKKHSCKQRKKVRLNLCIAGKCPEILQKTAFRHAILPFINVLKKYFKIAGKSKNQYQPAFQHKWRPCL